MGQSALRSLGIGVIALFALPALAAAQTTWDGSASDQWGNAANWSAGVPAAGNTVIIPDSSTTPNDPNLSSALGATDTADAIVLQMHRNAILDTGNRICFVRSITVLDAGLVGGTATINATGSAAGQGVRPRINNATISVLNGSLTIARVNSDMGTADLDVPVVGTNTLTISVFEHLNGDWIFGQSGTPTVVISDIINNNRIASNNSGADGTFQVLAGSVSVAGGGLSVVGPLTVSGGTLTITGDLHLGDGVDGTVTHSGGTIRVSGNWTADNNDNYLSSNAATVEWNGATQTISIGEGTLGNTDFINLSVSGSGTKTVTAYSPSPFTVAGNLTIDSSTLDMLNDKAVDVNGRISGTGTLVMTGTGNIECFALTVANYTAGTGTLEFDGASTTPNWSGTGPYGVVNVNPGGGNTVQLGSAVAATSITVNSGTFNQSTFGLDVNGDLTVTATGVFDQGAATITLSGDLNYQGNTAGNWLKDDAGLLSFDSGGAQVWNPSTGGTSALTGNVNIGNVQITPGTTVTIDDNDGVIARDITIQRGGSAGTLTAGNGNESAMATGTVLVQGVLTTSITAQEGYAFSALHFTIDTAGVFNEGDGGATVAGNLTVSNAAGWVENATGVLDFNGTTATQVWQGGTENFGAVVITGTQTVQLTTSAATVTTIDVNDDDLEILGVKLTHSGNLVIDATGRIAAANGGELEVTGTSQVLGTLETAIGAFTTAGLADLDGDFLATSTGTVTVGEGTLELAGAVVDFNTGNVTLTTAVAAGTVNFNGAVQAISTDANQSFFDVTVSNASLKTITAAAELDVDGALLLNGSLTLVGNADVDGGVTLNANTLTISGTVKVGGDFSGATGTLAATGSTLDFDGAGAQTITIGANSDVFDTVVISNAGTTTLAGTGPLSTLGVTVSGGTLDLNGLTLSLRNGDLTVASGAVIDPFNGAVSGGVTFAGTVAQVWTDETTGASNRGQNYGVVAVTNAAGVTLGGTTNEGVSVQSLSLTGGLNINNDILAFVGLGVDAPRSGAGALTGAGTIVFAGTSTAPGTTPVTVNGLSATASLLFVSPNAAQEFRSSASLTADDVTVTTGILDLRAASTFNGTTTIGANGRLENDTTPTLTHQFLDGTASVTILDGGEFVFTQPNLVLIFAEGSTVSAAQTSLLTVFNVQGTSGNLTTIRDQDASPGDSTRWNINIAAGVTFTAALLRIVDSAASPGLTASESSDDDDVAPSSNTGWSFLTANFYRGPAGGDWNVPGNWSKGTVPNTTDIATFDNLSNSAVLLATPASAVNALSLASNFPGANSLALNGFVLTVNNQTRVSAGTLSAAANSSRLTTGSLLVDGGTVTAGPGDGGAISISTVSVSMTSGTYTGGTGDLQVAGSLSVTGGTFTNAAGGNVLLIATGSWSGSAGASFGPVQISAGTVTLGANVTAGALTVNGGSIALSTQTLTVSSLSVTGTAFTPNTGTLTFSGGGTWTGTNGGNSYGAVTVAANTVTLGSDVRVASLDVTAGALNLGIGPFVFTTEGALTVAGNGFVPNGGSTVLAGTTGDWSGPAVTPGFGPVTVNNGRTATLTGLVRTTTLAIAGEVATNGNALDANGSISGAGTLDQTGGGAITVQGSLTGVTFQDGAGTLTFDGTGNWSGSSNFGAVVVSGAGVVTTLTSNVAVTGLTIQSSGELILGGQTLDANGSVEVGTTTGPTTGILDGLAAGSTVLVEGDLTVRVGSVVQMTGGATPTLSVTFDNAASDQTWTDQTTATEGQNYGTVTMTAVSRTVTIVGTNGVTAETIAVGANATLDYNGERLALIGSVATPLTVGAGGAVNDGSATTTGTVVYRSVSAGDVTVTTALVTYVNLELLGAETYVSSATLATSRDLTVGTGATYAPTAAVDVNRNFSIVGTYTEPAAANTTVFGNLTAGGTWTNAAGTLIFDGDGVTPQTWSGASNFGVVQIANGADVDAGSVLALVDLNINQGSLALFTGTTTASGNVTIGDTVAGAASLSTGAGGSLSVGATLTVNSDGTFTGGAGVTDVALSTVNLSVLATGVYTEGDGDTRLTGTLRADGTWNTDVDGLVDFVGGAQVWRGTTNVGNVRVNSGTVTATTSAAIACSALELIGTLDLSTAAIELICTGAININAGTLTGGAGAGAPAVSIDTVDLTLTSGTYAQGAGRTEVSSDLTVTAGTWTASAGTLVFDGTGTWNDNLGAVNFGAVAIEGVFTVTMSTNVDAASLIVQNGGTLQLGGFNLDLAGALNLGETVGPSLGILDANAASSTVNVAGNVAARVNSQVLNPGNLALTFDNNAAQTWLDDTGGNGQDWGTVSISNGADVQLTGGTVSVRTLTMGAAGNTFNTNDRTLRLTGDSANPLNTAAGGTVSDGGAGTTGTIIYAGTLTAAGNITLAGTGVTYENLAIDSAGEVYEASGAVNTTRGVQVMAGTLDLTVGPRVLDAGGQISVGDGSGAVNTAVLLNGAGVFAGAGFVVASDGTYTHNTFTLTFDTNDGNWTDGATTDFGTVVVTGAVVTMTTDVNASTVTVQGTGTLALGGRNLDLSGALTIGNGTAGTLNASAASSSVNVGTSAVVQVATSTISNSTNLTLTFDTTGGNWTDATGNNRDFGNVVVDAVTVTMTTGVDARSLLVQNAGTLQLGGFNLDCNGALSLGETGGPSAGTLSANAASSSVNVTGTVTAEAGSSILTPANLAFVFDITNAGQSWADNTGGNGLDWGFVSVLNGADVQLTGGTVTVETLTMGAAGNTFATNARTLRLVGDSATPLSTAAGGTVADGAGGTGTIVYAGTLTAAGNINVTTTGVTYENLTISSTGETYQAGATLNVAALSITAGTLDLSVGPRALDASGTITIGDTLAGPDAALTNGAGINAGAGFVVRTDGSYTHGSQTLTFDTNDGNWTDEVGTTNFGTVAVAGAITVTMTTSVDAAAVTVNGTGALQLGGNNLDVAGALTIGSGTAGTLSANAASSSVNVGTSFVVQVAASTILTPANLTTTFDTTGGNWTDSTTNNRDFGAVTVNGVTVTMTTGVDAQSVLVAGGGTLQLGGQNLDVVTSLTLGSLAGPSTGTLDANAASSSVNVGTSFVVQIAASTILTPANLTTTFDTTGGNWTDTTTNNRNFGAVNVSGVPVAMTTDVDARSVLVNGTTGALALGGFNLDLSTSLTIGSVTAGTLNASAAGSSVNVGTSFVVAVAASTISNAVNLATTFDTTGGNWTDSTGGNRDFGAVTVNGVTVALTTGVDARSVLVRGAGQLQLAGQNLDVLGALNIGDGTTAGTLNASAASSTVNVGTSLVVQFTGSAVTNPNNLAITFDTTGGSWTDSVGGNDFGDVTVTSVPVSVTTSVTAQDLTIDGTVSAALNITSASAITLTVTGALVVNDGTLDLNAAVEDNLLVVSGNVTVGDGTAPAASVNVRGGRLTATAALLTVASEGTVLCGNGVTGVTVSVADLTMNGAYNDGSAQTIVSDDLVVGTASWTAATGTLLFTGANAAWSGNFDIGNVQVQAAAAVTLGSSVGCRALDLDATITVGNNTLSVAGDLDGTGGTLGFGGTGTLRFDGAVNQAFTISDGCDTLDAVQVANTGVAAQTVTFTPVAAQVLLVADASSVADGILVLSLPSTFTSTFTVNNGGTLTAGANTTFNNATSLTIDTGGTFSSTTGGLSHFFAGLVTVNGSFNIQANGGTLSFDEQGAPSVDVNAGATFRVVGGPTPILMQDTDPGDGQVWQINVETLVGTFDVNTCTIDESDGAGTYVTSFPLGLPATNSTPGNNVTDWDFSSQTLSWTGTGSWNVAGNWTPNAVPLNGDTIEFTSNLAGNSTYDLNLTISSLLLNGYTNTLTLDNNLAVTGTVTVATGFLALVDNTLSVRGSLLYDGSDPSRITATTGKLSFDGGGTSDLNDSTNPAGATIPALCLPPVEVSNGTTLRLQDNVCVASISLLSGATVNLNGFTLTVMGDVTTVTGTTWTSGVGKVSFDGSVVHTWSGPTNLGTVEVTGSDELEVGSDVTCTTLTVLGTMDLAQATKQFSLTATGGVTITGGVFVGGSGANSVTNPGVTLDTEDLNASGLTGNYNGGTGLTLVSGSINFTTSAQWTDAGGTLRFDGGDAETWQTSLGTGDSFGAVQVRGTGTQIATSGGIAMGSLLVTQAGQLTLGGATTMGAVTLGEIAGPTAGTLILPAGLQTINTNAVSILNGTLNVNSNNFLNITGALNVGDPAETAATSGTLTIATGRVNVSTTVDVNGPAGLITTGAGLGAPNATLDVGTDFTVDLNGTFTEGTGSTQVGRHVIVNGTWNDNATAGQGALVFDGTVVQNFTVVPASTNLGVVQVASATSDVEPTTNLALESLDVQAGTFDLDTNDRELTLSGALLVSGGSCVQGNAVLRTGSLTVTSGTFDQGPVDTIVTGNVAITGNGFIDDTGELVFAGGAAQTWSGAGVTTFGAVRLVVTSTAVSATTNVTFGALTVNTSGGSLSLGGAATTTATGAVSLVLGDLSLNTHTVFQSTTSIASVATDTPILQNTATNGRTHEFQDTVSVNGEFQFTADNLTLRFREGTTCTVAATGTFVVQGAVSNRNLLVDDTPGDALSTLFTLALVSGGSITADFVNIQDCAATGPDVPRTATNASSFGNTPGWQFAAKTTAWDGGSATTNNWDDDANWTNDRPSDGDTVQFLIPSARPTSLMNISGLNLKLLTVSGYTGGTITLQADLGVDHATSTDAVNDGVFVSGGELDLGAGFDLIVTRRTSVSTGGTLDLSNAASEVRTSGNVDVTGTGAVTAADGAQFTFQGTAQTWGGVATADFGRVNVRNGTTVTLNADVITSNAAGQTAAEIAFVSTVTLAGNVLDVNGDLVLGLAGSAGGIDATDGGSASEVHVAGDYTITNAASGIVSPADLLTTFDGGTTQVFTTLGAAQDVGAVAVSGASTLVQLASALTCRSLNIAAGEVELQGQTLAVTGAAGIFGAGALDALNGGASSVTTGGAMTVSTFAPGTLLTFNGAGGNWGNGGGTFGAVTIDAPVSLVTNVLTAQLDILNTRTLATGIRTLTATGPIQGAGTLNASTGAVVAGNGLTVTNYTAGTSLLFNGTGDWSGAGANNYGAVEVSNAGVAIVVTLASDVTTSSIRIHETDTVELAGFTLDTNGNLELGFGTTAGFIDALDATGSDLEVGGTFSMLNASRILNPDDATTTFDGGVAGNFSPTAFDVGSLVIDTRTITLGQSLIAQALTLTGGGSLDAGNMNVNLSGAVDLSGGGAFTMQATRTLTLDGAGTRTFNPGTSTIAGFLTTAGTADVDVVTNALTVGNTTTVATGTILEVASTGHSFQGVTAPGSFRLAASATATATSVNFTGGGLVLGASSTLTIRGSTATPLAGPAGGFSAGASSTVIYDPMTTTPPETIAPLTYVNLTLDGTGSVPFTTAQPVTASGDLDLRDGALLTISDNLTAGDITSTVGGGTLDGNGFAGDTNLILADTISASVTLQGLTSNATPTALPQATVELRTAPATLPNAQFGHLTLNAGGAFTVSGGTLTVHGNLVLMGGATFAGAPILRFRGAGLSSCNVGSVTLTLGGITVEKSAATDTVTITGSGPITTQRNVNGPVVITTGVLTVNTSFRFLQNTTVGQLTGSVQGRLVIGTGATGTIFQFGDSTGRTVLVHDILIVSGASITLVIGVGDEILLTNAESRLNLDGTPGSKLQVDSTDSFTNPSGTTPGRGQISVDVPGGGGLAIITADDVSVRANDASGVLNSSNGLRPIVATNSVNRGSPDYGATGSNINWDFDGGGSLNILSATTLGDGNGRITRVRMFYSRALDFSTVGTIHQQFALRRVQGTNVLASITGTSANAVQTTAGQTLEITFGSGLAQTDLTDLQIVYTPPAGGFLESDDGIPALAGQTATPAGSPPLIDGAAPAVVNTFVQDIDSNGGLDRAVFFFSEPIAFSPGQGVSLSGFDPVIDTADLTGNTLLTLQIAGESSILVDVSVQGPQSTGANIARVIQETVREILTTSAPALHDPLKRAAYRNFTAEFSDGRYVLRAGVPLRFDTLNNIYVHDFASSSVVVVVGGAQDASTGLLLGVANGGVERPGRGDARGGISASAATGTYNLAGRQALLKFNQDDYHDYDLTSTTLGTVASELEDLVRQDEPDSLANASAYADFVAVADTVRNRLVLVSGAFGDGSAVVVNSTGTTPSFASVAQIGSSQAAFGAFELTGSSNTLITIADLSIRGQDGSNLLLGAVESDMVVTGSAVSIDLSNVPNSGVGTPAFLWRDDYDRAFISDRADVPNVIAGQATNLPISTTNVVLVGDLDGDLEVTAAPGSSTIDASASIAYVGTAGATVDYTWTFVTGPSVPTFTLSGPVLTISTTTAGTYRFQLEIVARDAGGLPIVSTNTDAQGRQIVFVDVVVSEDPPVALAGADVSFVGASVTLDGSASFDPNGGSISFVWSATNSSGQTLLASVFDTTVPSQPVFTPGASGIYTVTLQVMKSDGQVATDTVVVTLNNTSDLLPFANAGADQVARVSQLVRLDGTGSVDPEGLPLVFSWRSVSGPAPITLSDPFVASPTFTATLPGNYVFELVVMEGATTSVPDQTSVYVVDDVSAQPRLAPSASARAANLHHAIFLGSSPSTSFTQQAPTVRLADGTTRPVVLVDLESDAGDDPTTSATQGLTRLDVIVGTNEFASLYVDLETGDEDMAFVDLVDGGEAEVLPYGIVGERFTLDATRSLDDGVIQTFTWRQVSGPFRFDTRQGSLVSVVPIQAGTYVFELTVTDTIGLSSFPQRLQVQVLPPSLPGVGPPVARTTAGTSATAVEPTSGIGDNRIDLVVTAESDQQFQLSAEESESTNAGTLTYEWTQVGGPTAIMSNANTADLTAEATAPGAYAFMVKVTDQNDVSDYAIVRVTLAEPGRDAPVARIAQVADQVLPADGSFLLVALSGSQSTGDGALTYRWSQTSGFPAFVDADPNGTANVRIPLPGVYTFKLEVTDGTVTSAPSTMTFRATAAAEQALASGATTSKSSGGCSLASSPSRPGSSAWLLLFAFGGALFVSRRRVS